MRLSWSNQTDVAMALLAAYPDMDRLSLNHDLLLQLVFALPGFNDTPVPPSPACLDHILWTWMRLADESSSGSGFEEKERRRL